MQPERYSAVAEQAVVELPQRELRSSLGLVVLAELHDHQFAERIDDVGRIEGPAFGLAPRAALFEERLLLEEPDTLLHRHVLAVQSNANHEPAQPDQGLGELPESHRRIVPVKTLVDHHLFAVVRPAFDKRR